MSLQMLVQKRIQKRGTGDAKENNNRRVHEKP